MRRNNRGHTYRYEPDYAVAPGAVLAEMLQAREMSHAEFARRCGRSAKLISEIIAGKAPVEPETALQFERVLGMEARVWLNLEANHQLYEAKQDEEDSLRQQEEWACRFPVKELVKRGLIEKPSDKVDAARKLLAFFGVGSIGAWEDRYGQLAVSFRHSPCFASSQEALITWLRIGEIRAEEQHCAEFSRAEFLRALHDITGLTRRSPEEVVPRIVELCNGAGVAFVLVPALLKTSVSGAARWLGPRKALIQQSDRHKTHDHFWFTFFHEAAHIILHSKRSIFVDENGTIDERIEEEFVDEKGTKEGSIEEEKEADRWAGDQLVSRDAVRRFAGRRCISRQSVLDCARDYDLDPGILVGRLQHEGIVSWKNLNGLKRKIEIRRLPDGSFALASRAA